MGFDCGFDMVPRLENTEEEQYRWSKFLDEVKELYKHDTVFELRANFVEFEVGEHPLLPFEGYKFLRFSSKISSASTEAAEICIRQVCRIARKYFGSRIQFWHELNEDYIPAYGWDEVSKSIKSFYSSKPATVDVGLSSKPAPTAGVPKEKSRVVLDSEGKELYSLESIPGKGKGLVADRNISRGTRIISENPLFVVSSLKNHSSLEKLIASKLKQLSKDQQRAFLSLHNNYPGTITPFAGIVRTNALPLGPGASDGGLFLECSRINHACRPNCQNTWNSNRKEETIHAIRDIVKGEEVTISYTISGPSESRQSDLKGGFGIDCTCDLCSLPEAQLATSDKRRKEIVRLDALMGDGGRLISSPQECIDDAYALMMLLTSEGITDARLPRMYYDAFQMAIIHGDQARAKVFAQRSYEARLWCEGEDSPGTISIKALVAMPANHGSFGVSKKWKQSVGMIPRKLDGEEFEKWLWKQNKLLSS